MVVYTNLLSPISYQKGLSLILYKRKSPRDSTNRTARGVLLLVWGDNNSLSQEITIGAHRRR